MLLVGVHHSGWLTRFGLRKKGVGVWNFEGVWLQQLNEDIEELENRFHCQSSRPLELSPCR